MTGPASDRGQADFRHDPRKAREAAGERGVPEERAGAEPADADSPEFSHGEPLDEPQPSTRRRHELDSEQSRSTDADVRSDERDI
jgi:hypothetical protein